MVNVNKLKGRMVEKGLTGGQLSQLLSIDRATFYRKMASNGETFTVREVSEIATILQLDGEELNAIFFAQEIA